MTGSTRDYAQPSVFTATNLMREARRQRRLPDIPVPQICLLDPDGDTIRHLRKRRQARLHPGWACYHSQLWTTDLAGRQIGIVPCAVGGPYAVLVAEQLVASGCDLIISVTSAGSITPLGPTPHFVLIQRAWRDEGTSHHYLPPARWAHLRPDLAHALNDLAGLSEPVHRGTSWTTDAPFRETKAAIESAQRLGISTVEMEAAALYAFAEATGHDVVCVAHVTNTMAVDGDDFDKGEADGTDRILALTQAIAARLRPHDSADAGVALWPATTRRS